MSDSMRRVGRRAERGHQPRSRGHRVARGERQRLRRGHDRRAGDAGGARAWILFGDADRARRAGTASARLSGTGDVLTTGPTDPSGQYATEGDSGSGIRFLDDGALVGVFSHWECGADRQWTNHYAPTVLAENASWIRSVMVLPGGHWRGDAVVPGSAGDDDGDGVVLSDDNCPLDYNPDQRDDDGDGVGDTCDPCPTQVDASDVDSNLESEISNWAIRAGLDDYRHVAPSDPPEFARRRRLHYQGDGCEQVAMVPFSLERESFQSSSRGGGPVSPLSRASNTRLAYDTVERPFAQPRSYQWRFCKCSTSDLTTPEGLSSVLRWVSVRWMPRFGEPLGHVLGVVYRPGEDSLYALDETTSGVARQLRLWRIGRGGAGEVIARFPRLRRNPVWLSLGDRQELVLATTVAGASLALTADIVRGALVPRSLAIVPGVLAEAPALKGGTLSLPITDLFGWTVDVRSVPREGRSPLSSFAPCAAWL